jgi:hypothetical protein
MFGFNALGTLSPDGSTSIFSAKSGRKNPKDKMRQYEKNQVKQDGRKINNTSQKWSHPEVTSLPVSELNNVEKIEVGTTVW